MNKLYLNFCFEKNYTNILYFYSIYSWNILHVKIKLQNDNFCKTSTKRFIENVIKKLITHIIVYLEFTRFTFCCFTGCCYFHLIFNYVNMFSRIGDKLDLPIRKKIEKNKHYYNAKWQIKHNVGRWYLYCIMYNV